MSENNKRTTNPECAACGTAFNGINGRFCIILNRYVEHAQQPLCK